MHGKVCFLVCEKVLTTLPTPTHRYYTPNGTAKLGCGGQAVPVGMLPSTHGIGQGSSSAKLPTDKELVAWAKAKLSNW